MSNNEELEKDVELDIDTIEDESAKKHFQTLDAQKKHYKVKYQEEKNAFEEYKKAHPDTTVEVKKEEVSVAKVEEAPKQGTDDIEAVLELRSKGYSDAEVLTLRKYASKMKIPISEIINDPFIKSGIEAERQKATVEQNTPTPSAGTFTVKGKTWAEMTPEERKSNYSTFMNGGGNNSNI